MIRLIFRFALTIVVARWMYAEVQLSYPDMIPSIDSALELVQIPTHDKWDQEKLGALAQAVEGLANVKTAKAETGKVILAQTLATRCQGRACGERF